MAMVKYWGGGGGGNFIETSVIGISDTGIHLLKKYAIKQILKNIYIVFVVCTLIWTFHYCNIKAYLKTLTLGGINRD